MYKQYIKQALQMLRENTLVSIISIAGTALSIAMILVMVLVFQINSAGFSPESNRDRMLFVEGTGAMPKAENGERNNGQMSAEVVKECFYSLKKPEAVTAISSDKRPLSLPAERLYKEYPIHYVDHNFWKIFDFRFLSGHPFSESDFQSAIPRIVLSEEAATDLFGNEDATGKTVTLNFVSYQVSGVVSDVSTAASTVYAKAWIPYTCNKEIMDLSFFDGVSGNFMTVILAHSSSDFTAIREELQAQMKRYNEGKVEHVVDFFDNPISQFDKAMGSNGFGKKDWKEYMVGAGSVLFFLLLVPALNLTGVVQSSIQKRKREIGLRKAFGATGENLAMQLLTENLVVTALGGLVGVVLSILLLYVGKSFLLNSTVLLTIDMLFKPGLFGAAFLFIFLLNLLSAGLPAIRISRGQIVDALNGND